MFERNEYVRIQSLDHPKVIMVKRRMTPSMAATIAAGVAAIVAVLFAVSNAGAALFN